jgi:hypothetical protein
MQRSHAYKHKISTKKKAVFYLFFSILKLIWYLNIFVKNQIEPKRKV